MQRMNDADKPINHITRILARPQNASNPPQTSASECVLVTMLAARAQAIKHLKQQHPFVEESHLLSKLMAYCSKEAHSCVEKAAMISFVKLRILEPDEKSSLRSDTLIKVRGWTGVVVGGGWQWNRRGVIKEFLF